MYESCFVVLDTSFVSDYSNNSLKHFKKWATWFFYERHSLQFTICDIFLISCTRRFSLCATLHKHHVCKFLFLLNWIRTRFFSQQLSCATFLVFVCATNLLFADIFYWSDHVRHCNFSQFSHKKTFFRNWQIDMLNL